MESRASARGLRLVRSRFRNRNRCSSIGGIPRDSPLRNLGRRNMDRLRLAATVSTLALTLVIASILGLARQKIQANSKPQNAACVQGCRDKLNDCLSAIGNSPNSAGLRQACQDNYNSCVKRCSSERNLGKKAMQPACGPVRQNDWAILAAGAISRILAPPLTKTPSVRTVLRNALS
jgi:hypothetical protein